MARTSNNNKNNKFIIIFICRLRREYTGDWLNDKKTGRGTMFYKNEDRYDGYNTLYFNFLKKF